MLAGRSWRRMFYHCVFPGTSQAMRRLPCLLFLIAAATAAGSDDAALAQFGRLVYFDTNFSAQRTLSCASCHNPATAFADRRENALHGAVSIGDDGVSLGDRNTPSITYAALQPDFRRDESGEYVGGHFYDGRAATLEAQAREPFTNPAEMGLPDADAVVQRLLENEEYTSTMSALFGPAVFSTTEAAFDAVTRSLAAFQRSTEFSTFDSRYDRYLRGEYTLSATEELGRVLFYSQLFNCHSCHLIDTRETFERETFTTFKYHNIGVPVNAAVRTHNKLAAGYRDEGLRANPLVGDESQAGKFKVPSLRNVAVTPPYMHNGVFRELETVILFYNKYTLANSESQVNPETGRPWGPPEVPGTIELDLLRQGQPISPLHVSALRAFLETLTDERYESLLSR